jgi:energy-coupling factor transport system ATP-binding protein
MDDNYIIEIENLKFAYPAYEGETQPEFVLNGLNLKVKKGEFLSIMGPTGVGKTTLSLVINGIIPHSTGGLFGGSVKVCRMDTKEHTMAELAKKVGIVFQDPESQLFCMTVEDEVAFGLENVGMPREEMEIRITDALRAVDMEEYRERSPFHLSGGQKQRVAIAAMLAMEPEILILDEPTSGLDPIGKSEVFRVIHDLKTRKNMTVIMIEQESERVAEFSDRVVILYEGKAAMEGTPAEIFRKVRELRNIGISIPQMSELCYDYSVKTHAAGCDFISLDEAELFFTGGCA